MIEDSFLLENPGFCQKSIVQMTDIVSETLFRKLKILNFSLYMMNNGFIQTANKIKVIA